MDRRGRNKKRGMKERDHNRKEDTQLSNNELDSS